MVKYRLYLHSGGEKISLCHMIGIPANQEKRSGSTIPEARLKTDLRIVSITFSLLPICLILLASVLPGTTNADTDPPFAIEILYEPHAIEESPERNKDLSEFIQEHLPLSHASSILVIPMGVPGTSLQRSYHLVRLRGERMALRIREALEESQEGHTIEMANPIIPRQYNDQLTSSRVRLELYDDPAKMALAKKLYNQEAEENLQYWMQAKPEFQGKESDSLKGYPLLLPGEEQAPVALLSIALVAVELLLGLVPLVWFYRIRKTRNHLSINNDEQILLEMASLSQPDQMAEFSGELKIPQIKKSKTPRSMQDWIDMRKEFAMGQSTNNGNGFTFDQFLTGEFKGKSVEQILQSPVHALEGLSPRHSKILEEAFGIMTVEDLSRLKYVEIAKAFAIIAKYKNK